MEWESLETDASIDTALRNYKLDLLKPQAHFKIDEN